MKQTVIPAEPVESLIRVIRGQRVILDADLARVYGVTTKALNQAVKRNRERFPSDFLFRLTADEALAVQCSRSQFVTLKPGQNIKYLPYAFTEYGAFQASNVLNSPQAVQMGVFVVRVFVKMRETLIAHHELAEKLAVLERSLVARLDTHDHLISGIIKELHRLASPAEQPRKQIGFQVRERPAVYRTKKKL